MSNAGSLHRLVRCHGVVTYHHLCPHTHKNTPIRTFFAHKTKSAFDSAHQYLCAHKVPMAIRHQKSGNHHRPSFSSFGESKSRASQDAGICEAASASRRRCIMQTQAQDIVWQALPLMIAFGSWSTLAIQRRRTNPTSRERTVTEQIPTLLLGVAIGLLLFFASLFVASGIDAHALTPNV